MHRPCNPEMLSSNLRSGSINYLNNKYLYNISRLRAINFYSSDLLNINVKYKLSDIVERYYIKDKYLY